MAVDSSVVTTTAPAITSGRSPREAPITSDIMAVGIAAQYGRPSRSFHIVTR